MKALSQYLEPVVVEALREEIKKGTFSGVTFRNAMKFLLTDGVIPKSGLPAASFLKLEDWIRLREVVHPEELRFTATELKNKTGLILEHVVSGKKVSIERHGRPIAVITRA